MLENGFIKIHRSLLNWEWYEDTNTKSVFLHLLLTVNYEDRQWQGIEVRRGQRVASYQRLSTELKLSIKNIRTALNHLISTGEVAHTSTSKYGIFTVLNYEKYQGPADNTADERQSEGSQGAGNGQQCKKDNKANNEKEDSLPKQSSGGKLKKTFSDDSTEMKLSKLLFKKMRENNPTCKEPNFQDWCKNIDFMIRLDEREPKAIQDMILFSQWEPFWKTVILSTGKLRDKYDKLEIKRLGELAKSEERSV